MNERNGRTSEFIDNDLEAERSDSSARTERTIGGKLIGAVHDAFTGPPSLGEKNGRASNHDSIAEIAADTVALMPGLKMWAAGGIRAGILFNPGSGLRGTALNFGEGLALNGIGKLGGRLSTISTGTSTLDKIGGGVLGHFAFGSGLGATKALFREDSWFDRSGSFSFRQGLSSIEHAGITGGAINIPAGFLGSWIGGKAAAWGAAGKLAPREIAIAAGIGSGYASGAVFGAVEAERNGGNLLQILQGANHGGIVGSLAGGLSGRFARISIPTESVNRAVFRPRVFSLEPAAEAQLEVLFAQWQAAGKSMSPLALDPGRRVFLERMPYPCIEGQAVGQAAYAIAPRDVPLATRGLATCVALKVENSQLHYLAHLDVGVTPEQIKTSLKGFDLTRSDLYVQRGSMESSVLHTLLETFRDNPAVLARLKFVEPEPGSSDVGMISYRGRNYQLTNNIRRWPKVAPEPPTKAEWEALRVDTASNKPLR